MLILQGFSSYNDGLTLKSECKDTSNFPENKATFKKRSSIFQGNSIYFFGMKNFTLFTKKMKINTRKGTAKDLAAIYQLVYELAVYEKEPDALTASLEDYHRDFAAGYFETEVAEADGQVVGMVLYYDTYSTWKGRMMYLEDFVVAEKMRGQGVGQLLFDRFLDIAQERAARMVKWQVLDWNTPAIRFYEKNKAIIEKGWWNGKIFFQKQD